MEKSGGSKLLQMKAQYQQKQLAEREQKIASLYEAQQARALDRVRHSPGSTGTAGSHGSNGTSGSNGATSPAAYVPHGKVRQMFEERRTKGIDKSYPLQPIHNTRQPLANGHSKSSTGTSVRPEKKRPGVVSRKPVNVNHKSENRLVNGSGDVNHNHEADLHTHKHNNNNNNNNNSHVKQKPQPARSLAQTELRTLQQLDSLDALVSERALIEDETFPEALEPVTPRSVDEPRRPPRSCGCKDSISKWVSLYRDISRQLCLLISPKLAHVELRTLQQLDSLDALVSERALIEDETFPEALEPVTPRSVDEPRRPPRRSPSVKTSPGRASPAPPATPAPVAPPRRGNSNVTNNSRPARTMQQPASTVTAVARKQKMQSPPTGEGDACAVCGRRFAPERRAKHEAICKKTSTKKRKPFDALKHRLAGTEAEPFISRVRKQSSRPAASSKPLNSTWRQKHEEFINAIRSAKQAQAHVAAGGKLADLPPPPPSENPDYVQCPHCQRRFNQAAADRHIPKCKSYQFNKPKPGAKRR
ncbi:hypothetical protein JYU34_019007 [Plutella xylostella]|uniref:C2HC/C3H-type domain-containing protein n=1 Tax=Plutella xylostella TaxID=51655 RepID=A0ABQ7PZ05_PLUXY|nr:hypothetical protein JYU34_019007 [Plutella xylostella]